MNKVAITHPGKIGDMLYALHVARVISGIHHNSRVDFFTSGYCSPARTLVEYQKFIDKFDTVLPPMYVIESMDMGIQPARMNIPSQHEYDKVYHLGFRKVPDRALHEFMARSVGIYDPIPVWYDFPDLGYEIADNYVVVAPRGESGYSYLFQGIIDYEGITVVQVGSKGDALPIRNGSCIDCTGADLLETLYILSKAKAFLGLMSSNLVLANGFPDLIKIVPHDGKSWDMRHVLYSDNHHYLVNPTIDQALEKIGVESKMSDTFSKTMNPADKFDDNDVHVNGVRAAMGGAQHRFEHPHRIWEYSLALCAIRESGAKDVLDVGGGGSILAPCLAWPGVDIEVTQVDPGDVGSWVEQQNRVLRSLGADFKPVQFSQQDFFDFKANKKFDAVIAISVVEHVPDDLEFIQKMASFVRKNGLLVITTDFHPSGEAIVDGHLRTYSGEGLEFVADVLKEHGFQYYQGSPDWEGEHNHVNGQYNFASLVMQNK